MYLCALLQMYLYRASSAQVQYTCTSTRFSQSVENKQADAGDGTAESVSRDQTLRREHEDREKFILPVQLTTTRIGNLTGFFHTLL